MYLENTARSKSRCALRLQCIVIAHAHIITNCSNCIHKKKSHKQIYRKCLRIKLKGFGPVWTLVDITFKLPATFISAQQLSERTVYGVIKPTCPTNPVCVRVNISCHIIIHHCPDVRNVQSTSWLQKHYNSVHENTTGH